jgi:ADP-heptose:LPS heptosyltransferase
MVLLGGPEDAETAERIIADSSSGLIYNACGKYSLNQSVSLLKASKAAIAHDTGLMHISGAFNKPIVSVWGGTSAYFFGVGPYLNEQNVEAVVPNLPCHPCSNFGLSACPKKHFKCMNEQSEEFIAGTILKMTGGN